MPDHNERPLRSGCFPCSRGEKRSLIAICSNAYSESVYLLRRCPSVIVILLIAEGFKCEVKSMHGWAYVCACGGGDHDTNLNCFWAFIPFPDFTLPLCHSDVQHEQTCRPHTHTHLSCRLVGFKLLFGRLTLTITVTATCKTLILNPYPNLNANSKIILSPKDINDFQCVLIQTDLIIFQLIFLWNCRDNIFKGSLTGTQVFPPFPFPKP